MRDETGSGTHTERHTARGTQEHTMRQTGRGTHTARQTERRNQRVEHLHFNARDRTHDDSTKMTHLGAHGVVRLSHLQNISVAEISPVRCSLFVVRSIRFRSIDPAWMSRMDGSRSAWSERTNTLFAATSLTDHTATPSRHALNEHSPRSQSVKPYTQPCTHSHAHAPCNH